MSRRSPILLLTILAVGVGWGQRIEGMIPLPDSMSGVMTPVTIVRNSVCNTIMIADRTTPTAVVLNCSTGQKIARKTLPEAVNVACHDPVRNRYYCVGEHLIVLDGATYEVLRWISLPTLTSEMVCHNQTAGKVYVGPQRFSRAALTVVDTNYVVSQIDITSPGKFFCADAQHNKLYVTWADSGAVAVVDCATDSVTKLVPVPVLPYAFAYNHVSGKLYCAGVGGLCVIDAAADSLVRYLPLGASGDSLGFNSISNKVYYSDRDAEVVIVVSCENDSVVAEVEASRAHWFAFDSLDNLVYCYCWGADRGSYAVIDGHTNQKLAEIKSSDCPERLCYDPVLNRVYAGGSTVMVIDCALRSIVDSIALWLSPVSLTYVAEADEVYFACLWEDEVGVVDCRAGRMTNLLPVGREPTLVEYVPEEDKVYCANAQDSTVTVIDCRGDSVVTTLKAGYRPSDFCYVPGLRRVYVANRDEAVLTVIDARADSVLRWVPMPGGVEAVAYSGPSNRLYCALVFDSTLLVLDPGPDTVVGAVGVIGVDHLLCHIPATDELACIGTFLGSALVVVDCPTGMVTDTVWVGIGAQEVAYHPFRHKLYTADGPGWTCTVVDCATWRVDTFLPIEEPPPTAVSLDLRSDLAYVVSSGRLGKVTAIDCATNSIVAELQIEYQPYDAVWNPADGKTYVAVSNRSSIAVISDSASAIRAQRAQSETIPSSSSVIRGALPLACPVPADLLDIAGRRVLELKAGENDIRHVAPGVYFLREGSRGQGFEGPSVRKVVIQK